MRAVLGLVDMAQAAPERLPLCGIASGRTLDEANSASGPTSTSGKTASDSAFRSRRKVLVLDILTNKVVVVVAGRKDRSWRD